MQEAEGTFIVAFSCATAQIPLTSFVDTAWLRSLLLNQSPPADVTCLCVPLCLQEAEGTFMVAFSSADVAVEWCLMVQQVLRDMSWPDR